MLHPRQLLLTTAVAAALLSSCRSPDERPATSVSAPTSLTTALTTRPSVDSRPASSPPAVSAWPGAIHDARHSSAVAPDVVGPTSGRVRWTRRLEGNVTPGPALAADGTVYAASNAGTLHALDPATGRDRWRFDGGASYGSDLSTTPAVLADGTVLWPGPKSTLYALDAAGRLLWKEAFPGFVLSPADRGDGRVYVADMAGTLRAIDVGAAAGGHRVAWSVTLGRTSYGSPVVAPDGSVVSTVDDEVVGVTDRGDSAVVRWRWRAPAIVEVSAAVAPDGTVVVGPNDDYVYGLSADGALRWKWRKGDWSYSSAAITPDGRAYLGDHLGFLDVLDASTGDLVRRHATIAKSEPHPGGVGVWTAPAVDAAGNVYFGTVVGHVYGFAADGRRLFDLDVGATVDSYPALGADGTLYIGSAGGDLYALAGGTTP